MNSTAADLLETATGLKNLLRSDAIPPMSDTEKLALLRAAGEVSRLIDATLVETAATVDTEFSDKHGCRNLNELFQRAIRTDPAGAARIMKASRLIARDVSMTSGEFLPARWPEMRKALMDGTVGIAGLLSATTPVEQVVSRVGTTGILQADAVLAEYARGYQATDDADADLGADAESDAPADAPADAAPPATPEDLKHLALIIAMHLDPDGPEPSDKAHQLRSLTIGREKDGLFPIRGNLLPEVKAQLQLLLDAQLNPKVDGPPDLGVSFHPSDEADTSEDAGPEEDPFNSDPHYRIDNRSYAQKQHDAFAAALGIAARHEDMPSLGGGAPTLVVNVDVTNLTAGTGWANIPGVDAAVPVSAASQTACTGAIQRVLFDQGRIVGITTTDRVFTVHQRRAIVARDKECLIPGCHVPASWCEIHHVIEHSRGGPTTTDNGVPLCWWHHRSLDYSGWEIRMANGLPQVRGPAWWDPAQKWRTPRPKVSLRV